MQIRDTFIVSAPTIDAPPEILAARTAFDEAKAHHNRTIQDHLMAMEQLKFAPGRDREATINLVRAGEKVDKPVTTAQEEAQSNLSLREALREAAYQDLEAAHTALRHAYIDHQQDWADNLDETYNERRMALLRTTFETVEAVEELSQQLALWQWVVYSDEWGEEYGYRNVGAPRRNANEFANDIAALREAAQRVFSRIPDEMAPPGATRWMPATSTLPGMKNPYEITTTV